MIPLEQLDDKAVLLGGALDSGLAFFLNHAKRNRYWQRREKVLGKTNTTQRVEIFLPKPARRSDSGAADFRTSAPGRNFAIG